MLEWNYVKGGEVDSLVTRKVVLVDLRTVPVEEQKKTPLGQRAKVVKNVVARRHSSPEKCVTKGMRSPCEDKLQESQVVPRMKPRESRKERE